jgi:hypothetical protein
MDLNENKEEDTRSGHSKSKINTEKKETTKIVSMRNLGSNYKL